MESIEQIINSIISFALLDPRIDAVIVTGEMAQQQQADRFSEINVEVIGSSYRELADDTRWIRRFGEPLIIRRTESDTQDGPAWPCCRVLFAKGRRAEFILAGPERLQQMTESGLNRVWQQGYAVLLDKTGITAGLPERAGQAALIALPDHASFSDNWQRFWLAAAELPVWYLRNAPWTARLQSRALKMLLLTQLEWLMLLRNGGSETVRFEPSQLSNHLTPMLYRRFLKTLDNRDRTHGAHALMQLLALYRDVALQVSDAMAFDTDATLADNVTALAENLLNADDLLAGADDSV